MGLVPARRPGWLLERRGNPSPRGMAAQSRFLKRDGQNPAYRPSGIYFAQSHKGTKRALASHLRDLVSLCEPKSFLCQLSLASEA